MPNPTDVNPRNFQVERVLYNDEEFSVVVGTWQDSSHRLAMRWNGIGDDAGYPKTFRHPVWFILPENLSEPITRALLGVDGSVNVEIIEALREFHGIPSVVGEAV